VCRKVTRRIPSVRPRPDLLGPGIGARSASFAVAAFMSRSFALLLSQRAFLPTQASVDTLAALGIHLQIRAANAKRSFARL
jgi:hypothetical protein